jgi:nicotinate-nucleotide pyrophosphorylase (carboxylating)
VTHGDVFGEVAGDAASILVGERVALNFMQRMSGIATATADLVAAVAGTGAK